MSKLPAKQSTAKAREAAKKGEITPVDAASLQADPMYVDTLTDHSEDVTTGSKHGCDDLEAESTEVQHKLKGLLTNQLWSKTAMLVHHHWSQMTFSQSILE